MTHFNDKNIREFKLKHHFTYTSIFACCVYEILFQLKIFFERVQRPRTKATVAMTQNHYIFCST